MQLTFHCKYDYHLHPNVQVNFIHRFRLIHMCYLTPMLALFLAASLSFEWNPVTNATDYAVYLNNRAEWVGSNTTCTITVQPLVNYTAQVTAINSFGESDRSLPLTALVRPVDLYFERSLSVTGLWQVAQTNTAYMVETGPVRFYRARVGIP